VKLDREQTISIGVLSLLLLACACAVELSFQVRSEAAQEFTERQEMLSRLEAMSRRAAPGGPAGAAPPVAFLDAPSQGLAGAQLQSYLAEVAGARQGALISSGLEQAKREDPTDTIRLQATLDASWNALQAMLYQLESGTPYVIVEALAVQPTGAVTGRPIEDPLLRCTLSLRAFWRRGTP
jgi:general secretion pathway protein M